MTHTPGSYLCHQREAAGFSIDDVALRIETDPPVGAIRRAIWQSGIEEGLASVSLSAAWALSKIPELAIDLGELSRLCDRAETLVHFMPAPTLDECR